MFLVVGNAATADGLIRASGVPPAHAVGDVLAIGSGGGDDVWLPGGAAIGTAIAVSEHSAVRLWHPLPAAGSGPVADQLLASIDEHRVDRTNCPVAPFLVRALIVEAGDSRLCWSERGPSIAPDELDLLFAGVDHVVFCPRWGTWSEAVLAAATERAIPVSFVGAIPPGSPGIRWHIGVADRRQFADAPHVAVDVSVLTSGVNGADLQVTADGRDVTTTHVDAVRVDVVDTTGAGDAFGGVFIAAMAHGAGLEEAGRLAAVAAAERCTHWGAIPPPQGISQAASPAPISAPRPTKEVPVVTPSTPDDDPETPLGDGAMPISAEPSLRQRALGALWGQACGDAFGMPNSFLRLPVWRTSMEPGPANSPYHAGYPAGRVTDDTEQAQSLSAAFAASDGPLDYLKAAAELTEWLDRVGGQESLAVGPSTKLAMSRIKQGVPIEEAGTRGVTNGAAMRIAVVGVWAALNDYTFDALLDDVRAACLPTHNTSIAIAGAAAVATAVWSGMRGMAWDVSVHQAVLAAERGADMGTWVYAPSVAARIEHACSLARECADEIEMASALADVIGMGEATAESVPAAFAAATFAERDPEVAIRVAGNARGDADTVAAMAGAMSGAYSGALRIPRAWRELVAKVNGLDVEAWAAMLDRSGRQHAGRSVIGTSSKQATGETSPYDGKVR